MDQSNNTQTGGVSVTSGGNANIGGDVAGRDIIKGNVTVNIYSSPSPSSEVDTYKAPLAGYGSLYIIADHPDIAEFDPLSSSRTRYRSQPGMDVRGNVVAVDAEHLHNYLLPLNCPRVTFYALAESSLADVERLMGLSTAKYIVAIQSDWLAEVQAAKLYKYEVPGDSFTLTDPGGGHYTSREPVIPRAVTPMENLLKEILSFDIELRVTPSLWKLFDAVAASTLQFSMIRMRNAGPR